MKKFVALLLTLTLLFAVALPAAATETGAVRTSQNLIVDGAYANCEIYNIGGYNYFKLRDIAALLTGTGSQFDVGYNADTQAMILSPGAAYTPVADDLKIGEDKSATATESPQAVRMGGGLVSGLSIYNIGGFNYFKLRELGETLGFDVDYDEHSGTMLVMSRGARKAELTAEQIYSRCVPAVFLIEVFDMYGYSIGTGSGFFLDTYGTAVTNWHVTEGAESAAVTYIGADGQTHAAAVRGVYDFSEEEDWIILQVEGSGFSYLQPGAADTVIGGATVYALGSPEGLSATLSEGLISNPSRTLDDGQTYIQTSAPISHGSSGGALINKYGQVVGITCAGFEGAQNLNLAVPISKIENY
jgi:hypothetical protein